VLSNPQNKGIALIIIGVLGIIAAIYKEWGVVMSVVSGCLALLNFERG